MRLPGLRAAEVVWPFSPNRLLCQRGTASAGRRSLPVTRGDRLLTAAVRFFIFLRTYGRLPTIITVIIIIWSPYLLHTWRRPVTSVESRRARARGGAWGGERERANRWHMHVGVGSSCMYVVLGSPTSRLLNPKYEVKAGREAHLSLQPYIPDEMTCPSAARRQLWVNDLTWCDWRRYGSHVGRQAGSGCWQAEYLPRWRLMKVVCPH